MVKRPENKLCADCKRNDPRWASWNLGVFLCIRCSGIHRGMGTHISKVKSVDLDVWTPEQMESIQKWGNHRANLYWEAHLKSGHTPPEHKMESFIRSKYESRRWALDGLPPVDPSVLENASSAAIPDPSSSQIPEQTQPKSVTSTRPSHATISSISRQSNVAINPPPQHHQLLSAVYSNRQPNTTSADSSVPQPVHHESTLQTNIPQNDLFSLDFHAPPPVNNAPVQQVKKDFKQDILSLFSSPPGATQPATAGFGHYNNTPVTASSSPWGSIQPQQPNVVGAWGASSAWTGPSAPDLPNTVWANSPQHQQASLLNTSNVWDGMNFGPPAQQQSQSTFSEPFSATPVHKKDDVFGDLWGDFK